MGLYPNKIGCIGNEADCSGNEPCQATPLWGSKYPEAYNGGGCSSSCSTKIVSSDRVSYTGPNLPCTGINTCTSLTVIIQQFDEIICSLIEGSSINPNLQVVLAAGNTATIPINITYLDTRSYVGINGAGLVGVSNVGGSLEFIAEPLNAGIPTPYLQYFDFNNGNGSTISFAKTGNATVPEGNGTFAFKSDIHVFKSKVTITPAQMLDLVANPVELIPAPGAGKVINLIRMGVFIDFNTVAYNFSTAFQINVGTVLYTQLVTSTLNTASDRFVVNSFFNSLGNSGSFSDIINQPIVATSVSNATQGDSPVTVILTYTIDDFN